MLLLLACLYDHSEFNGLVAQLAEQDSLKVEVQGSSPCGAIYQGQVLPAGGAGGSGSPSRHFYLLLGAGMVYFDEEDGVPDEMYGKFLEWCQHNIGAEVWDCPIGPPHTYHRGVKLFLETLFKMKCSDYFENKVEYNFDNWPEEGA